MEKNLGSAFLAILIYDWNIVAEIEITFLEVAEFIFDCIKKEFNINTK